MDIIEDNPSCVLISDIGKMVRRIASSPMHYYPLMSDKIYAGVGDLSKYVLVESIAWDTTVMVCCKVRLYPHPFRTDL